jgi:excisionase family DNA binding protein
MDDTSKENDSQSSLDDLITLVEAAKISGLSHDHLRRLAGRGDLKAKKIGRDWLTTERAVREYLAQDRRPGPKPK